MLDTHVLLWALGHPDRLSERARSIIDDPLNRPAFSSISICEITIKGNLGRPSFRLDPNLVRRELLDLGYEDLPLTSAHSVGVASLPPIHKDPFDRLLIAQATVEGILFMTADDTILRYPGPIQRA